MSNSHLKKININKLAVGMYVQAITDKKGKLSVKSQGHIKQACMIDILKKKGVVTLVIDTSKQLCELQNLKDVPDNEGDLENCKKETLPEISFSSEIDKASKLYKQGKVIQKSLMRSVKNGLPYDEQISKEFATEMVNSIDRNSNALLCLTKIRDKDDYLLEHSLNVAILLANFGKSIGMSSAEVEELAHAGFLHDIGKIKIPDDILNKPGRLTDSEMDVMRKHVVYGVETLKESSLNSSLIRVVSEHHERLDGLGYPYGKKGDEISQAGRMIAIADVYDALTADRVYKSGMSGQKALQILLKDCPEKYDHILLQHFIKCMGIYPVGTLVKLSNERIAMVIEQNKEKPLKPKVNVFYSTRGNHYLEGKDLNLVESTVSIEKPVLANDYKIDVKTIFERNVLASISD
ncbi:HD-GYP domain-containing protein [Alteromonas sp. 5E99-2]|uniref:HD-GYP domain-containing protein n=1 Tax=Alteromonas sp. 5E99-2 TaxID=2817683 RepID=UPI001A997BC6|nr:HD-GYP domain-containing protein [Alteromonas sp. 5E99-2]MBO1256767.1 HD-GYP domain-containing protein [Alteromonas sp. 5E99-2]